MEELRTLALSGSLDAIVLAVPIQEPARFAAAQALLCDIPVRICLALDTSCFGEAAIPGATPIVDLAPVPQASIAGAAKRALDLVLAGSALLVLLPALCLIGLAIRHESPGSALFRQWRFGVGSRPIRVFKFRTMRDDLADPTGERRTTSRDPRVTRIGRLLRRTSLDELPQLINVMRGEMSLVGPRPHPLHMKVEGSFYFDVVPGYQARHRVLPGITGWAQINGSRGEVDTLEKAHRRVELDLWYINNWSLGLDLKIITRTLLGGFASLKAD
jgi:lipopolysaccharide/colanic/teichoic acid biosynthesis glycosyltransferase